MSLLQSSKPSDPLANLRIDRSRPRSPPTRWLGKLIWFALLIALVAGGYLGWKEYGDAFTRPTVKVGSVEVVVSDAADSVLSAQGYLKSEKQAAIGAKVPGRVLKVYVREGQAVDENTLLAELEHADVDQTLEAMKASLDAMRASADAIEVALAKAKAELAEVESNLEQDKREYERAERLFGTRQLSTADFEQAESEWKASRSRRDSMVAAVALSEARLREARAQCRESEARYRETEQQRQNLFVRAPFKGIVISKEAEEGESIMPGGMGAASGRGSVVTLADLLHLEVETDVKEDYVSRVKKDQQVSVAVDAVPNRRFKGKVRTIIPMGDRAKGTVKVKVQLDVAEVRSVNDPTTETFTLFPEMAASVHFLGEQKSAKDAQAPRIFAPSEAVEVAGDQSIVWVVQGERLRRVVVQVGDTMGNRTEILRGLKGGEKLVLDPPLGLQDNLRVTVTQ